MIRAHSLLVVGVLALACAGLGPSPARACSRAYRLHVQGHLGSGGRVLDLDVPWDSNRVGSPFNFTADASEDVGLDRLRWAWSALQRMPEGQTVTIDTRSESIRAWRVAGYLVLEPHHNSQEDDHHSRIKIPDYIVNAILDNDGRLTERDIDRLARQRGKVTLVKVNSDQGGVSVWVGRAEKDQGD